MRDIKEISKDRRLRNIESGFDGFRADIHIGGWDGSVIYSHGAGWEHVSVRPYAGRITPSWEDMCKVKEMFWNDDEAVIQVHPVKADYVNNVPNCLHLWRCTYRDMVLPPSILVGIRDGQTQSEITREIEDAYKMAGEEWWD